MERPVEWTARLGRALREEGVPCSVLESLTACEALEQLDASDGLDVYFGLEAAFTSSPDHKAAYERCFWALWGGSQPGEPASADGRASERGERGAAGGGAAGTTVLERLHRAGAAEDGRARHSTAVEEASYSPDERLSHRSFERMDERDLRRVDRIFDRILLRLATRKSRRYRPHRRKGRLDLRRSFRDAVVHDGELLRLARRRRRLERPRVVLLCDVSGSMERYSRFLLRFLLAAGRDRDVESFVFSTRLTRLTPWLSASHVDHALDSLGTRVHDWSGGTRIGECLDEFVREHGRSLLGQRTVMVILSDGLDRGDVKLLERAMRAMHRKARKVIWLNPLLSSSQYEPAARGMRAALPHIDIFAPGHNLESLLELERHLTLA
jgi:uncharacterized protein with von Willebrand factor type A (vWA) domain